MLVEVKIPQLSESVSEATLLTWHKKAGDYVQRDENLIDIETDKVVLELPAPESGVLAKIAKGDGGTVTSNEVIATIDTEAKPAAAAATGVRKPMSSKTPAATPAMPASQAVVRPSTFPMIALVPLIRTVDPSAALNTNSPKPNRPSGKAWNNLVRLFSRSPLFVAQGLLRRPLITG